MSRSCALLLALCIAGSAAAEDLTLCHEAWTASQAGKNDRALELYDECLEKGNLSHSSLAQIQRNVGILRFNAREPVLAAEAFGRALAENPPDAWQDHVYRGNALLEAGDSRKALADFEQALELKPDHPAAVYGRAVAYERLGREFDAYAEYARASELAIESQGVGERLRAYQRLKLDRAAKLRGAGFGALGSSYAIGVPARARKLGAISANDTSCVREELDPSALSESPIAGSLRSSGRFEFPSGGVAVVLPQLAELETVDVRIHLDDHVRGVRDDYLTFCEGAAGPARAAVLVTTLAKRMRSSMEVHRAILDELEQLSAGFPREDLVIRDLDGPWGALVEILVRDLAGGGVCFPTSAFQRSAPERPTIGVIRYVHRGELLVELALVVPLPKDLAKAEQGEYARKRMDELMGAVTIPQPGSRPP